MIKKMYEEENNTYDLILNSHMAEIFLYAKAYVPGLLKAREDIKIKCLHNANWKVLEHTVSVHSILQDVSLGGKKVF